VIPWEAFVGIDWKLGGLVLANPLVEESGKAAKG
jgi:hypothetical protein